MEPIITIDSVRSREYYDYLVFTVRLSGPATDAVTVNYQALPQTAEWSDLGSTLSGTVTFAIGETVKTITLRSDHDYLDERDEAFLVELRDPINANFGSNIHSLSTIGWIMDDDGTTSNNQAVAVSNPVVTETGGGKAVFTVSLSEPFTSSQSLRYQTYDISANAGSDYVAKSGRINFLAGQTEALIEVDLINNNLAETAESFGLAITGTADVASAFGVAQILDTDASLPVISIEGDAASEYYEYVRFTIRLSEPSRDAVTVNYQALPQTADWSDLSSTLSGTVTFAAGETVKTVQIRTDYDRVDEQDEAFIMELRSPVGATFGGNNESLSAVGWILDQDGTTVGNRSIAISDPIVTEGANGKAVFTVSPSEAFDTAQTFDYQTQNGSAKAGTDYVAKTGSVTFQAGQTEAAVEVDLINNGAAEASESFNLVVPGANGVRSAAGTALILDEDASVPVLSVDGASAREYYDYLYFTVRMSEASRQAVTVDYGVLAKTASTGDLSSTTTGTLTFEAGETVKTITLRSDYDTVDELDEAFLLELRNPAGATFGGGNATLTAMGWILDDDGPFVNRTIAISDSTVTEGPSGREAVFAVEMSQAHTEAITVSYRTVNGTATAGADYSARSGTVTFEPGQTRVLVTVPIRNDLISESPETFQLRITPPYPSAISASTTAVWGTGTILDGTRRGTEAGETLNGTDDADAIDGLGGNDLIRGLDGKDVLSGGNGNDTLNGGGGADTMLGGAGNDLYYVGGGNDRVVEYSGNGIDTVRAGFAYALGANLERLVLTGGGNIAGTGNALANVVTGNTGNNRLKGLAGNDRLVGLAGNDRLEGGNGRDTLVGGAGNDTLLGAGGNDLLQGGNGADVLNGGAGNDTMTGGGGNDSMAGGLGNDRYVVGAGDKLTELAGQGVDTVQAFRDWGLGANFENLVLGGNAGIDGSGNGLGNVIVGNGGQNTLKGFGGNDRLVGGAAGDQLVGGGGNDTLLGGNGNDALNGGFGNDLLEGGGGRDTLGGAAGNDNLKGLAGNDRLFAGNGKDTLNGGNGNDLLEGGGGNDLLAGAAGNDNLKGQNGNDQLFGGNGRDTLNGGAGVDRLEGGGGKDFLYGGDDAVRDVFVFRSFAHSNSGFANRDHVFDFASGRDDIDMSGLDANTRARGDQDFDFNGTSAAANSVWYVKQAAGVLVRADHNGDARADFEIFVDGISRLGENDFIF